MYEFYTFLTPVYKESMLVDVYNKTEYIYANLDMEFPKLPCSLLSIDVADNLGNHLLNVHGSVEKIRLNPAGEMIGIFEDYSERGMYVENKQLDLNQMQDQKANFEGCRLHGYLQLAKVPGNFHVSCHAMYNVINKVYPNLNEYDTSHKVNYLYFTDHIIDDIKKYKTNDYQYVLNRKSNLIYDKENYLKSYGDFIKINMLGDRTEAYNSAMWLSYYYHVNLIPTRIEDNLSGHSLYQYNFKPYSGRNHGGCSGVFFNWEVNSISVKISPDEQNTLSYFIIRLFAILGGVLNLTWIVDAFVYQFNMKILKKAEMNRID